MMQPIPRIPPTLQVPVFLSPSLIGSWRECRLKLFALHSPDRAALEFLPKGPFAEFGTIAHKAIKAAASGDRDAVAAFERMIDERQITLAANAASARYADLRAAVGPARIAATRDLVERQLRRLSAPTRTEVPPRRRGREVFLESTALRLRGSADLIRGGRASAEIVDLKTGNTTDDSGQARPAYALQLQAYALMLLEQEPEVRLQLSLDNGERVVVPSDEEALSAARRRIDAITALLPLGPEFVTTGLATAGSDCYQCPLRPGCAAYRETAPTWWHDVPGDVKAPADIWGRIQRIESRPDGITATLVDASGRGVRIVGLDEQIGIAAEREGTELAFFNLEVDAMKPGFQGQRPHTRLFRDGPVRPGQHRAWTLAVFQFEAS